MSPTASACITGCSGRWVWISTRPGPLLAPGAAGDLVEQLEGALGGAQVAAAEAEIGVDHADQREVGEVVALGDDLGAEQDVDGVGLHRLDQRGRRAWTSAGVSLVITATPRLGQELAPAPRPAARPPARTRSAADARRSSGSARARAWRSRNDGTAAGRAGGGRPARPSSSGRRAGGRRRGTR